MTIERLGAHGAPAPDPRKTGPATKGDRVSGSESLLGQGTGKSATPSDQVILSAEALAAGASSDVPTGELPVERIREIGLRLSNGFYDQPSVIERVTRELLREFPGLGSDPR